MSNVLTIIALIVFATSLFARSVDPVIPLIAGDLAVAPTTVALLSTAFALPFAFIQPVLGILADLTGKSKLMTICLGILALATLASALAPNFESLLAARIICGLAAGGIFPVSLAVAADLVPVAQRQVAIGRLLTAAMMGNLLGGTMAGAVGDLLGWRAVFFTTTGIGVLALAAAILSFRKHRIDKPVALDLKSLIPNYLGIFRHPLAKYCFGAVFFEGVFANGVFPYVGVLLLQGGEARASIAGVILAGYGLGAALYGMSVSRLLGRLGEVGIMRAGAGLVALGLLATALRLLWPVEIFNFIVMGFGFYMLHGVIQIYATELSPHARASAVSLHSAFYFLGQASGPVYYGFGFAQVGPTATLAASAIGFALVGLVCSLKLRRSAKPS
jgi:predicted MFS family arabinose efflux permease